MSASFCWHCSKKLVGKNGSSTTRPLCFRVIKLAPDQEVRVHVGCEESALASIKRITAAPSIK